MVSLAASSMAVNSSSLAKALVKIQLRICFTQSKSCSHCK
eukprot:gene20024-28347_t